MSRLRRIKHLPSAGAFEPALQGRDGREDRAW